MHPVHQLLERNIELFEDGNWLFINPPESDFFSLIQNTKADVLHQTFDVFSKATGISQALSFESKEIVADPNSLFHAKQINNHNHIFAPYITNGDYSDVLIYMPKSKSQFDFLMHMATNATRATGRIYVVGENRSGVKSANKRMQQYGLVNKQDSARHCTLMSLNLNERAATFVPENYIGFQTYQVQDIQWQCASFPGVFSEGELDAGTHLLLSNLNSPLQGNILDFACGAGVITCFIGNKYNVFIDLLDVSAIALLCAAFSLSKNGFTGTLIAANGLNGVSTHYDGIITNPPFHTGLKTDYSIVSQFIEDAFPLLKNEGELIMVANRFLPYAEQLTTVFDLVETVEQDSRFSIYRSLKGVKV